MYMWFFLKNKDPVTSIIKYSRGYKSYIQSWLISSFWIWNFFLFDQNQHILVERISISSNRKNLMKFKYSKKTILWIMNKQGCFSIFFSKLFENFFQEYTKRPRQCQVFLLHLWWVDCWLKFGLIKIILFLITIRKENNSKTTIKWAIDWKKFSLFTCLPVYWLIKIEGHQDNGEPKWNDY